MTAVLAGRPMPAKTQPGAARSAGDGQGARAAQVSVPQLSAGGHHAAGAGAAAYGYEFAGNTPEETARNLLIAAAGGAVGRKLARAVGRHFRRMEDAAQELRAAREEARRARRPHFVPFLVPDADTMGRRKSRRCRVIRGVSRPPGGSWCSVCWCESRSLSGYSGYDLPDSSPLSA